MNEAVSHQSSPVLEGVSHPYVCDVVFGSGVYEIHLANMPFYAKRDFHGSHLGRKVVHGVKNLWCEGDRQGAKALKKRLAAGIEPERTKIPVVVGVTWTINRDKESQNVVIHLWNNAAFQPILVDENYRKISDATPEQHQAALDILTQQIAEDVGSYLEAARLNAPDGETPDYYDYVPTDLSVDYNLQSLATATPNTAIS